MKRFARGYLIGAALAILLILLAACSTSVAPSIGQYGVVTGQGLFSNQTIKDVVDPGQQLSVGSGDTSWYLPAQVRNYVTSAAPNADRQLSQAMAVLTAPAKGSQGMSVKVSTYVAFQLNPNHSGASFGALGHFMPFCLKYGCASQTAQDTNAIAHASRSSTPGWLNMLDETFPTAIDNATRDAVQKYGPSLWTDQSQWGALAKDIGAELPSTLAAVDGSATSGGYNYFCGPGATGSKCPPPLVIVKGVWPTDPAVVAAYNQGVSASYSEAAGAKRLAAAKAVYGPDANWTLAMKDLISQCQNARVPCTFYVGQPPVHP